jgi:hypothetical protein
MQVNLPPPSIIKGDKNQIILFVHHPFLTINTQNNAICQKWLYFINNLKGLAVPVRLYSGKFQLIN